MKNKKIKKKIIFVFAFFVILHFAYSQNYYSFNPKDIYGSEYEMFFPSVGTSAYCNETKNFLIYVDPFDACQPEVVRTDLLEEQPVDVYCKLKTINLNPLLQSIRIESVSIWVENKSPIVEGAIFHLPYLGEQIMTRAFRPETKSGLAYWDNLGYARVRLKQEPDEKKIPERVDVNATAEIRYTAGYLFGIDRNTFDLPKLSEEEWKARYNDFSFFNGKGFLRLLELREDSADVMIYKESINDPTPLRVILMKGRPTPIGFWGFFCDNQNFELELISVDLPKTKARLIINNDEYLLGNLESDGGCKVLSIEESVLGGGKVKVECGGNIETLTLLPGEVKLRYQNKEYLLGIGENLEIRDTEKKEKKYAYLIYARKKDNKKEAIFAISPKLLPLHEIETLINLAYDKQDIQKLKNVASGITFSDNIEGIEIVDVFEIVNEKLDPDVMQAYQQARSKYESLALKYRDQVDETGEYVGARALYDSALLALKLGRKYDAIEILSKLIDEYKGTSSRFVDDATSLRDQLSRFEGKEARKVIITPTKDYIVELRGIVAPRSSSINAKLRVNGEEVNGILNMHIGQGWIISEITEREVMLKKVKGEDRRIEVIKLGEEKTIDVEPELKVKVIETHVEKVATVVVRPPTQVFVARSNFSLHIGIEKRAIQIGPEKTKEYIKKLNKTIATLQGINNKLANVVTEWKKACYIGGTALFVKNFLQGLGGKATARKIAMHGIDGRSGWIEWCQERIGKEYSSLTQCYRENANKIEEDVNQISGILKNINSRIKAASKCSDNKCYFDNLNIEELRCNNDEKCDKINNFITNLTVLTDEGIFFKENAKDVLLGLEVIKCEKCSDASKNSAKNKLYNDALAYRIPETFLGKQDLPFAGLVNSVIDVRQRTVLHKTIVLKEERNIEVNKESLRGKEYFIAQIAGLGLHYFVVKRQPGGNLEITAVYKYENENLSDPAECNKQAEQERKKGCLDWLKSVLQVQESECNVGIKTEYRKANFYETGQWKGRLAYMPIEIRGLNGLYVYIPDEFKVKSYLENGMLNLFWICNVGSNQIPDLALYAQPNDDYCIQVNMETWPSLANTPLCYETPQITVGSVIQQIQSCVAEANKQKREGQKEVKTTCGKFPISTARRIPTVQCEDFMSSRDCWLLFNLCDPVLCPPSRCDLGGRYPTENVVASGIIGSLVLCLPNFENGKGTLVPVCLTGLNAGLDGLISILNASRDCLQESLTTGKTVGICDQIRSIYLCEFMWRELMPFMKIGIPSIIEKFERKGGGEYALFSDAWRTTTDSFNYFVQYYGTTAIEAFKLRSTAEVGSMLCKKFIGLRYPNAANLLEELAKPESPYQFFATVTEIPYTEVTTPPQSQYKVYYHIYAGKDQGVYYSVYLKSPTVYPGFMSQEQYIIDTGFIARGDYKEAAKDFTAQAGYKEVCVNINAKEYCGFNVVTQSFAVNWLQDRYINDQIKEHITRASECTSGKPSLIPTASIVNLQAGITQFIEPAIYKQGITRVCSSKSPGIGVEEASWAPVGYCDNPEIKCWVYMPSIRQAIKDIGLVNQTIKSLDEARRLEAAKAILGKETKLFEREEIDKMLDELKEVESKNKNLISEIENLISKGQKNINLAQISERIEITEKIIIENEKKLILVIDFESLRDLEIQLAQLYNQRALLKHYEKNAQRLAEEKAKEKEEKKKQEKPATEAVTPQPPPEEKPTEVKPEIKAFLVAGLDNNGVYDNKGRTIEYDDKTEICLVLEKDGTYYSGKKISIKSGMQQLQTTKQIKDGNVQITWEVILPIIKRDKDGYKALAGKKSDHWVRRDGRYYEIIEYSNSSISKSNNKWCIQPTNADGEVVNGTFWYRAIGKVVINGKNYIFDTGPKFNPGDKTKLESDYYYAVSPEQCESGNICAGVLAIDPGKVMRISRKSNFGKEHPNLCQNNEIGCKLIETAESFYNVPYVFRHPRTICPVDGGHYIASDLGLAADCGTLIQSVLQMNNIPKTFILFDAKWENLQSMSIAKGVYVGDIFEVPHGAAFVYTDKDNDPSTITSDDELLAMSREFGTIATKKIRDITYINNNTQVRLYRAKQS
ncbi:MAG: hypothetical protein QW622_00220 [Candidatus Pacearchaeota archaeon]